jgi:hypothetical protein
MRSSKDPLSRLQHIFYHFFRPVTRYCGGTNVCRSVRVQNAAIRGANLQNHAVADFNCSNRSRILDASQSKIRIDGVASVLVRFPSRE